MPYEPFIPSVFSANKRAQSADLTALAKFLTVGELDRNYQAVKLADEKRWFQKFMNQHGIV